MSFDHALAMILEGRGTHFDPAVVDVFQTIAQRLYDELEVDGGKFAQVLLEKKLHLYFDLAA